MCIHAPKDVFRCGHSSTVCSISKLRTTKFLSQEPGYVNCVWSYNGILPAVRVNRPQLCSRACTEAAAWATGPWAEIRTLTSPCCSRFALCLPHQPGTSLWVENCPFFPPFHSGLNQVSSSLEIFLTTHSRGQ